MLEPTDAVSIGRPVPPGGGPKLVLGPGTGLGMAALVVVGARAAPLPGEAGHIGFGPLDEEDGRVFPRLEHHFGRLTPETILSGPGLVRLHKALAPDFWPRAGGRRGRAAGGRRAGSLRGRAPTARRPSRPSSSIWRAFQATWASSSPRPAESSSAAGVMSSLAPMMDPVRFRALFEDKAPVEALARALPLMQLPSDAVILRAMGAVGAEPDRFVIDYPARLWRI